VSPAIQANRIDDRSPEQNKPDPDRWVRGPVFRTD